MTAAARRNAMVEASSLFFLEELEGESESKEMTLRKSALRNMNAMAEPPVDHPPSRLLSKEEKELFKLQLTMDRLSMKVKSLKKGNQKSGNAFDAEGSQEMTHKSVAESTAAMANDRKTKHLAQAEAVKKMLGVDTSEVCMSLLGVPSLWTIPGEKDVYGNTIKICKKNGGTVPEKPTPPAFSELSISAMLREGLIDIESKHILRKVSANADSVLVYDR